MTGMQAATFIPPQLENSRLYADGGCAVIQSLFSPATVAELAAEAQASKALGNRCVLARGKENEGRGGSPPRAFTTAPGGLTQQRVFHSPALIAYLTKLTGLAAEPTGGGSYSFYEQEGDFLDLHLDIFTCDMAVITCLQDEAADENAGRLLVYPSHVGEPLASVRAGGRTGARAVMLRPGDTVALLGGLVPHEVTPMSCQQKRTISVMCYRTDR